MNNAKKFLHKEVTITGVCRGGITRDYPRTFDRDQYDQQDPDINNYKMTIHLDQESADLMEVLHIECKEIFGKEKNVQPFIYDFKSYKNLFTHRFSCPEKEPEEDGIFNEKDPNLGIFSIVSLVKAPYGERGYIRPSHIPVRMTFECNFDKGMFKPIFSLKSACEYF